jgi:class 3 adenylate cyclase
MIRASTLPSACSSSPLSTRSFACAEATDGQILVSRGVAIAVEDSAELEEIGDLSLKGLSQAVAVYNVVQ